MGEVICNIIIIACAVFMIGIMIMVIREWWRYYR